MAKETQPQYKWSAVEFHHFCTKLGVQSQKAVRELKIHSSGVILAYFLNVTNSLAPGRCGSHFQSVIFKFMQNTSMGTHSL